MTSIKAQLDTMLKRSLNLCGFTVDENGNRVGKHEAVQGFIKALAADSTSPKEVAEKIVAAWDDKTGKLQRELCGARVEQVGNFIATESIFKSAFFSTVTLQPDEQPFYVNETANETRVGVAGDGGKPEQVRVVAPQERTAVGLYVLVSDKVKIQTMDIYRGDIRQSQLKTLNVARDLTFKLDRVHYNLLTATVANGGCFGAFSTEQSNSNKSTRIYVAHSGIDTSHLPTTNAIVNGTTSGPTGTRFTVQYYDAASSNLTGFRPAVLRSIIDYAACWGNVLPDNTGLLVPTGEIIVPSSDIINIAAGLLPSNDDTANSLNQQVTENGYFMLNLLGRNWKFIPDLTIASGTCFPRFNVVPGLSYEKPSYDKEFTSMDDAAEWETRWQRKGYGAVIPAQWRPRAMKITYAAA